MAILTDQNRAALWAEVMREMSAGGEGCSITKTDLRLALNAVDQWVDDNSAAFNSAIPQPARSALTSKQKARLLAYVVRRRFEVS
jgi:hypothetical protein